jgi:molybdopterin-guanine dinucleotide biosynthesis protein A
MVALSSILKTLPNQKVFIIPVDSPLVKEDTIMQMIANSNENYDVTICADNHKVHNLIGIFDRKIIPQIEEMLQNNNHKINHLLSQKLKTRIIYFEDSEQFINLNTPDDLKKVHT